MIALGHGTIGSNNLDQAKAFYDRLFELVDIGILFEHPSGGRVYGKDEKPFFVVLSPYDEQPATVGNGTMHGFSFETPEQVDAFYAKAVALGAREDGAPGFRAPTFYMSYFRDLDGNTLCAFSTR